MQAAADPPGPAAMVDPAASLGDDDVDQAFINAGEDIEMGNPSDEGQQREVVMAASEDGDGVASPPGEVGEAGEEGGFAFGDHNSDDDDADVQDVNSVSILADCTCGDQTASDRFSPSLQNRLCPLDKPKYEPKLKSRRA